MCHMTLNFGKQVIISCPWCMIQDLVNNNILHDTDLSFHAILRREYDLAIYVYNQIKVRSIMQFSI